jgi:hypothetical protein
LDEYLFLSQSIKWQNAEYMKEQSILRTVVILAVLATSSLTLLQSAAAAPAPIFRPIIREIQNQLTRGMVMRLPASLELTNIDGERVTIYPILEPDSREELRISLVTEPNCQARYCQWGYIATFQPSLNHSNFLESVGTDQYRHTARITLKKGIIGTYVNADTGGVSSIPFGVVIWEQDGQTFVVSLPLVNKQKILDIAISIANELPITSAR